MKKYILIRILKSFISIFFVVSIVILLVYNLVPRSKIFDLDDTIRKLSGDAKISYMFARYEELGYLDYVSYSDICKMADVDQSKCLTVGSPEMKKAIENAESKGYKVERYEKGNVPYGYHDFNFFEQLVRFYSNLIKIDNPFVINDKSNPNLERKYYFGSDNAGNFGVFCSGCRYKYQLYFNAKFPFIHQNFFKLNVGNSYPVKSGVPTFQVIGSGQGKQKTVQQTFPSGKKMSSAILQGTCQYKNTDSLDRLDKEKFVDNYANCISEYQAPSMINTSYIFGILSLVFAYALALPAGIAMARNKGKLIDKMGIVYINFLISVPSLAFIFFLKAVGYGFGMPDKFPQYGFFDVRSYILPVIILSLMSTAGIMTWIRRYMIDQSNMDYVKFAKSKGLSKKEIFRNHILRNSIIPFVNGIPSSIILAISGAFITESVFAIPGMGKMLPDSITILNNNMVITLILIFTSLSVFSVLIGDILMTVVDPRISLSNKGGE